MMKINTQEIVDLIASQTGQTKKFSEQFLKELVDVIAEYLQKDGIVKVKGLGTFKVIMVEERKSVDVASGNEIVLPSHSKVQFLPEASVKQQVNEPFSHLETAVVEPVNDKGELINDKGELRRVDERKRIKESEEKNNEGKRSHWWISIVVLAVLLVALFFTRPYWLPYIENFAGIEPAPVEEPMTEPVVVDTIAAPEVDSTLLSYQDSVSLAETEGLVKDTVDASLPFDIHSYTYQMAAEVPVREVVTVIDGSRLTMVAYRAYGSKDFWPYVYDANRDVLRSPSGVRKGMELKIADLPKELTDPDSPDAVEFARELGKKY